jgi:RimJ/RimL family protein N-acetyltransferase
LANIVLQPLAAEHAEATFEWLSSEDIRDNLGLRRDPSLQATLEFTSCCASAVDVYARAILVDGLHVGNIVVDHVDRRNHKARLHVYIGARTARGKGTGKSALKLAVPEAFLALPIQKLFLTVHAANASAVATYLAVGFKIEGVHRAEFWYREGLVDEIHMGILRRECLPGEH